MTRPLPDRPSTTHQTTANRHPKGSDHDHHTHHRTEDDSCTADAGTNQQEPSHGDGDQADHPDGGDRSDTARTRRRRQATTVGRPERAGDGSAPSAPHRPTDPASRRVTAKTGRSRGRGAPARPIPTPQEWAQEQLKRAPERSRAWVVRVAAIYGLEPPADTHHGS